MSSKIALFLVEGYSDQVSFENILNHLSDDKVKFKIIGGDITSNSNERNVDKKIAGHINNFLKVKKFNSSDITKIVHLVDIDGVFVDDNFFVEDKSINSLKYEQGKCFVKEKDQIISRNVNKRAVVRLLSERNFINLHGRCVPYEIYYFSCNLEHVLHNNPNVTTQEDKVNLSSLFADKYFGNEKQFPLDLRQSTYITKCSYADSWSKVINSNNKFLRLTNFNLFFDNIQ